MRRFTRLTNGFSKKIETTATPSLHVMYYNFVRRQETLDGLTPAMAASVSDRLWHMSDIVALVEKAESAPETRTLQEKKFK